MTGVQTVRVKKDEADWRLDKWFKIHFPELTYGRLSKLLRTGQIRMDGKRVKANARISPGNEIRVPPLGAAPDAPRADYVPAVTAEEVRYARELIIHEDEDIVVLNKPPGLAVQGGSGAIYYDGTHWKLCQSGNGTSEGGWNYS